MTTKEKEAAKRMLKDAEKDVAKSSGVGISCLNYGLRPSEELHAILSSTGMRVSKPVFLGYYHFSRKAD